MIETHAFLGQGPSIAGISGLYRFAGPPATVTVTVTHSRVTGTASASLWLSGGGPQNADLGLCYQPSDGGPIDILNFAGSSFSTHLFTEQRQSFTAAATKVLDPGTYNVGMCIRNQGESSILVGSVNGWLQVTT